MRAMVLEEPGRALVPREVPTPSPGPGELLLDVLACGVCRTDLHVLDGELDEPKLPLIPGHQIVARVAGHGPGVAAPAVGARVGVPWLGGSCGSCRFCVAGDENLCDDAVYTGYRKDGGFAQRCVADARFVFPIPAGVEDAEAAPLLCAGLIGWRCLRMAGAGARVGLFGFGAAAHVLVQVLAWQGRETYAFTRPGDSAAQDFARTLGATWAGGSDLDPPCELDAAILFAPVGELVPRALAAVRKGGVVVCGGIHMSDVPSFPYRLLWGERVLRSVANLTRRDGEELLEVAARIPVRTAVTEYALEDANAALEDLRHGRFQGAAVVRVGVQA